LRPKAALGGHIEHIRETVQRHGKPLKPDRPSLFQMVREVGLQDEYEALSGLYSKYVHASAWFVLRKRDHIDLPPFRIAVQLHTQIYAADILARIEGLRAQ
jgi:hypothetical protein